MNIRLFHWLLLILIGGGSCRTFIKKKYHLEKAFSYRSRRAYLEFLVANTGIPEAHWLYVDSTYYQYFLGEIQNGDHSYLYWKMLKDSATSVYPEKMEMLNCVGKTEDFILNFCEKSHLVEDSNFLKTEDHKKKTLRYLSDGKFFEQEKIKLFPAHFLIYGYGFGNYYFPFYKRMFRYLENNQDIFFICIDPVFQLE